MGRGGIAGPAGPAAEPRAATAPLTYACPDAVLGAAVARLVADVAEGSGRDVALAWQGTEAYLALDGERVASAWSCGGRREAAAYLAGVFQGVLAERLGGAPLPACPGHPHAAAVRTTPGGVGWHCPATGAVLRAYRVEAPPVAH
jgi:hypothetical protein